MEVTTSLRNSIRHTVQVASRLPMGASAVKVGEGRWPAKASGRMASNCTQVAPVTSNQPVPGVLARMRYSTLSV